MDANAADRRWLEVAKRVLKQKKGDSQKVYSLHEPEVYCLSKGKEHKKYEFGAKSSVVVGKTHGVILGAYSLPENDYDGHTLDPALQQVERIAKYRPKVAIADRGYRGKSKCGETEILTPNPPKKRRNQPRKAKGTTEVPQESSDRTTNRTPQKRLSTGPQLPQRPKRRCHQLAIGCGRLEPEPLDEEDSFGTILLASIFTQKFHHPPQISSNTIYTK